MSAVKLKIDIITVAYCTGFSFSGRSSLIKYVGFIEANIMQTLYAKSNMRVLLIYHDSLFKHIRSFSNAVNSCKLVLLFSPKFKYIFFLTDTNSKWSLFLYKKGDLFLKSRGCTLTDQTCNTTPFFFLL